MAFAKVDENSRIIECAATKGVGYNTEFSNLDYVEENCVAGLEDFVIIDGEAVYSPTVEKQIVSLEKELKDDDYISSKFLRSLLKDCYSMDDFLAVLDNYREEYGDRILKNHNKATRINELEKQIAK